MIEPPIDYTFEPVVPAIKRSTVSTTLKIVFILTHRIITSELSEPKITWFILNYDKFKDKRNVSKLLNSTSILLYLVVTVLCVRLIYTSYHSHIYLVDFQLEMQL